MFIRLLFLLVFFSSQANSQEQDFNYEQYSSVQGSSSPSTMETILESQNLSELLDEFTKEELDSIKLEILKPEEVLKETNYINTNIYISNEAKVACTICVADNDTECASRKTQQECVSPAVSSSSSSNSSSTSSSALTLKPPVDEQGYNRCIWNPNNTQYTGSACYSYRQDCCRKTCQNAEKPHQCIVTSGRESPDRPVSFSLVADLVKSKTQDGGPCDPARTNVYFTGHGNSQAYQFATVSACEVSGTTHLGCQTFGFTSSTTPTSPWMSAMEWAMEQAKRNKTINVCGNQMTSLAGNQCHVSGGRMCIKVTPNGEAQTIPSQCYNTSATSTSGVQCAFNTNESPYAYCSTSATAGATFYRNRLGCQKCEASTTTNGVSFGHWVPVEVSECCLASNYVPQEFCDVEPVAEGSFDYTDYWGCCVDSSRSESGTRGDAYYTQIQGGRCPGNGIEKRKDLLEGGTRPLSRQECRDENGYCCVTDEVTKVNSIQECSGTVRITSDIPARENFCPLTTAQHDGDPYICCDNAHPSVGSRNRDWLRESQCKQRFNSSDCNRSCYEVGANPECCRIPGVANEAACNDTSTSPVCCSFNGTRMPVFLYQNDCRRLGGEHSHYSVCRNTINDTKDINSPKICCHVPVYGNSPEYSTITVPKYISISQCLAETGNSGVFTQDEATCLATSSRACCQRGNRKAWESAATCSQATNGYPAGTILSFVVSEAVCNAL